MTLHSLNIQGRPFRLAPGANLSAEAAEVFTALVGAVQPEHFRPGDRPTIDALAGAIVVCRQLEAELSKRGPVDDGGQVSPLVRALRAQHALVASLSTRLRLTPSSRADRKTAGRTASGRESVGEVFDRVGQ